MFFKPVVVAALDDGVEVDAHARRQGGVDAAQRRAEGARRARELVRQGRLAGVQRYEEPVEPGLAEARAVLRAREADRVSCVLLQ